MCPGPDPGAHFCTRSPPFSRISSGSPRRAPAPVRSRGSSRAPSRGLHRGLGGRSGTAAPLGSLGPGPPARFPPPGAALAPEPRPVLGSGSGKFPCRGASPGARLGPFCPRDGLGAPARRTGLSSWRPRPNPAAPARPRPWLNFDGAEVGVYLPDCRETLGWGRPGCFATAADSGGLKPDRALMWPYLGLRESPRNLLREAPRGLGEADWVYFIFSLIPKPRHWGSRSHRAAAGRLGLGEVWGGGRRELQPPQLFLSVPPGSLVVSRCPQRCRGSPHSTQLSLREAPAGLDPGGIGPVQPWKLTGGEAKAPWMGPAGPQPCPARPGGLAEPLLTRPLSPPAEARALPQPEPSPRCPPWTPESSKGVSMSRSPSGYSCTERFVSPALCGEPCLLLCPGDCWSCCGLTNVLLAPGQGLGCSQRRK